jgi:hypothetical protein
MQKNEVEMLPNIVTLIAAPRQHASLRICCIALFFVVAFPNPLYSQRRVVPSVTPLEKSLRQLNSVDPDLLVVAVESGRYFPTRLGMDDTTPRSIDSVADDFGLMMQSFGNVRAIAPSTMILIDPNPKSPDIYANIGSYQAFPFLAASLSDTQWDALLSNTGLAVSDLNTPWQQEMFDQLISGNGKLLIHPRFEPGDMGGNGETDESSELQLSHIRLAGKVSYGIPVDGNPNSTYIGLTIPTDDNAERPYDVVHDPQLNTSQIHGLQVTAVVANTSKKCDLDYDSRQCHADVSLSSVTSIDDLLAAVDRATLQEIYCDPRLAAEHLILYGANHAEAGDLLQSLALCVTGTYRAVGPAYVLTDDLVGAATCRLKWSEVDQESTESIQKPLLQAQNYNYVHHSLDELSSYGASDWFSSDQVKTLGPFGTFQSLRLPFASLTPAQQTAVTQIIGHENEMFPDFQLTSTGKISVSPALDLQLLLPTVDQPISLLGEGHLDIPFVFKIPDNQHRIDWYRPPPLSADNSAAIRTMWKTLQKAPSIAVLVHPRSLAGVDADIAAMQALGIKNMWLDVFSDGQSKLSATHQLLSEALTRTVGTPIQVYPVLDLFFWGKTPPDDAIDTNVLGQSSEDASEHWHQRAAELTSGQPMQDSYGDGAVVPDFTGVAVAVSNATVQQTLQSAVAEATSQPEVAGVVLRGTTAPGYTSYDPRRDTNEFDLGYTLENRLAFLRAKHADPLDIFPNSNAQQSEILTVPPIFRDNPDNDTLTAAWIKYKAGTNVTFMASLYKIAQSAPHDLASLPVLIEQRGDEGLDGRFGYSGIIHGLTRLYCPWDGRAPLPQLPRQDPPSAAPTDAIQPITYENLQYLVNGTTLSSLLPYPEQTQNAKPNPIVLDLSDDPAGDDGNGNDPLTRLAALITKSKDH